MGFKENLRYYREKAGYAQAKEFAKKLDIAYSTYIGYESKGVEPKYEMLCKISKVLDVSIDTLLNGEDEKLSYKDEDKIRKLVQNLLSKFDTTNSFKLRAKNPFNLPVPDDFLEKDVLNFSVLNQLCSTILIKTFVDKSNEISSFMSELKDELTFNYLASFISKKVLLNLNDDIQTKKHFFNAKNPIVTSYENGERVLTGAELKKFLDIAKKDYEIDLSQVKMIENLYKIQENTTLIIVNKLLNFVMSLNHEISILEDDEKGNEIINK